MSALDPLGEFTLIEVVMGCAIVSNLAGIDMYAGIQILRGEGGEASAQASAIIAMLKEVGYFALSFMPIIGTFIAIKDLAAFVKDAVSLVRAIVPRGETPAMLAIAFGIALVVVVAVVLAPPARKAFGTLVRSVKQRIARMQYKGIGATGEVGEKYLRKLGGRPQVRFKTSLGPRRVDQLVQGVAHESKVGRVSGSVSKGTDLWKQIRKDKEILRESPEVRAYVWDFFISPVTGKGGPTETVRKELLEAGVEIVEHF